MMRNNARFVLWWMYLHLVNKRTNYFTRIISKKKKRKIIDIEPPLRAHTHTRILRGRKIGRDTRMRSIPFHKCFSTRFSIWYSLNTFQIPITLREKMQMRGVLRYSSRERSSYISFSQCMFRILPRIVYSVNVDDRGFVCVNYGKAKYLR